MTRHSSCKAPVEWTLKAFQVTWPISELYDATMRHDTCSTANGPTKWRGAPLGPVANRIILRLSLSFGSHVARRLHKVRENISSNQRVIRASLASSLSQSWYTNSAKNVGNDSILHMCRSALSPALCRPVRISKHMVMMKKGESRCIINVTKVGT